MYDLIKSVRVELDLIKFWCISQRDTFPIHPTHKALNLDVDSSSSHLCHCCNFLFLNFAAVTMVPHHCSVSFFSTFISQYLLASILHWPSLFISISQIYNMFFFLFWLCSAWFSSSQPNPFSISHHRLWIGKQTLAVFFFFKFLCQVCVSISIIEIHKKF